MTSLRGEPDITKRKMETPVDTVREIEKFVYREAELLDDWRLDEWLQLFSRDARYEIPATDCPEGKFGRDLMIISDTYPVLSGRVRRLSRPDAYAERPRSRTRRLISNVQILNQDDKEITATANFATYRFKAGVTDLYVGKLVWILETNSQTKFQIKSRKAFLDHDALRPSGKISIIL